MIEYGFGFGFTVEGEIGSRSVVGDSGRVRGSVSKFVSEVMVRSRSGVGF